MHSTVILRRLYTVRPCNCLWRPSTRRFSVKSLDKNIVKSPAPFLDLPKGNFVKALFKDVDKWWMKTAIECSQTNVKYTYSELLEQTSKWSGYLTQMGVAKGDVISMISSNCLQFPPIFYGTAEIGVALSPINPRFTCDEIERMLEMVKSKVIIFDSELEPTLTQVLKGNAKNYNLLCIGEAKELKAQNINKILYGEQKFQSQPVEITGNEITFIPFSSGTTGHPKAVALSHNACLANLHQFMSPYHDLTRRATDTFQENTMAMFPFFHVYGTFAILSGTFCCGGKVVVMPKFSPSDFLNTIAKYQISFLHTVPSLLNLINYSPQCTPEILSSVESLFCGAAPVLQTQIDLFKKKAKKGVLTFEGFGMTEVLLTNITPRRYQDSTGCGHLMPNIEAKVISTETGEVLGPNEPGEICIKTPAVMEGYIGNPSATREFLKDDGWAHTGDIGYYDENEFFFVVDRTKDLIKVHGLQVSPSEVEEQLQKHPSVAECSVIGVPNEKTGESPFAFVVLKGEASEKDIETFLKDKLAKHKQLTGVKFVDALPKSETGKVLKRMLRTML